MRCDHALRIALALVVSTSLVGCRGIRSKLGGCSTCGQTVGHPFVVSDSIISDGSSYGGSYVADSGCTTCQKSFDVSEGDYEEGEAEEPLMVGSPEPLVLPTTDGAQQSFSVKPTPDEQPLRPETAAPEQPVKPVTVEKQPPMIPMTPPTTSAAPRPAGINVDVRSSMSVAMVGQDVAFDIALANAGGTAIDSVDLAVTFSEGLRPKSVSPEGVARIEGQRIIFDQVKRFAPMTLNYRIVAEATAGMPESRMTLEVTSPILTAGAIKRETVVRITP